MAHQNTSQGRMLPENMIWPEKCRKMFRNNIIRITLIFLVEMRFLNCFIFLYNKRLGENKTKNLNLNIKNTWTLTTRND